MAVVDTAKCGKSGLTGGTREDRGRGRLRRTLDCQAKELELSPGELREVSVGEDAP